MKIEIDKSSGFCFGVTSAIHKAEEELSMSDSLYCLGDIVHNRRECERLNQLGLKTIDHDTFTELRNTKVLLRAHGEPPETYRMAEANNITLIDATCPVVLRLQRRIKAVFDGSSADKRPQIVIYGKPGHAEVLGLVGQTAGQALVIADATELDKLDFSRDICLFSQTTKSLDGFRHIVNSITNRMISPAKFEYYDTICRNVAGRLPGVKDFAARHDVILFVCGLKSSNGRVLFEACKAINAKSYLVEDPAAINPEWVVGAKSVGICGATSTPLWLMEQCKSAVELFAGQHE